MSRTLLLVLPTAICIVAVPAGSSGIRPPATTDPNRSLNVPAYHSRQDEKKAKQLAPDRLPAPAVEIRATLDKDRVHPWEKVRITEVVAHDREIGVGAFRHRVYLIADFDATQLQFLAREPEEYQWRDPGQDFSGLPQNLVGLNRLPWPFTVTTPRTKGFEFEFTPEHLGIFQITADWGLKGGVGRVQSQPVILVVHPPVDENGKKVVKQIWLIHGNR